MLIVAIYLLFDFIPMSMDRIHMFISSHVYATSHMSIHLMYMSFLIKFQNSGVPSGFGCETGWTGSVTKMVRSVPMCSPSTTDSGMFPVANQSTEKFPVPEPAGPVWRPVSKKTVN